MSGRNLAGMRGSGWPVITYKSGTWRRSLHSLLSSLPYFSLPFTRRDITFRGIEGGRTDIRMTFFHVIVVGIVCGGLGAGGWFAMPKGPQQT